MPVKIAINGFGRIGRNAFKVALEKPDLEVVAVNDLASARVLAHLLKYDSVYGILSNEVRVEEDHDQVHEVVLTEGEAKDKEHFLKTQPQESHLIISDGEKLLQRVHVFSEKDSLRLPWREFGVDVVLECSGRFTENDEAAVHLRAGAKRVIVSAPTKGGSARTFLLGVNSHDYRGEEIVSNASCTTNCISPVAAVMVSQFGVAKAVMTTIHAYTAEQNLVDGIPPHLHEDLRRGRAAGINIAPTTTGAAVSTTEVVPELKGIFDGLSIRVPVPAGSLADFTFLLKRPVTVEAVNQAFMKASESALYKGIIEVTTEPLVSSDIVGSTFSAVVDLSLTKVIDGDLVKVIAWYDNEWGYANRLVEMAQLVGRSLTV